MGELFIKVIEDVGVDSSIQIMTDNAPICKATDMNVEAKYPTNISQISISILDTLNGSFFEFNTRFI